MSGNRSALYALLLFLSLDHLSLTAVPVLQALALIAAAALPARVMAREGWTARGSPGSSSSSSSMRLMALPVLAGALAPLPFTAAYLMPDMATAVLVLVAATLTAFAGRMLPAERLAALLIGIASVLTHASHPAIAGLMIPAALLGGLVAGGRRTWIWAPLLLALVVGAALAERVAFRAAVSSLKQASVVYQPFLTVRLIADGPGRAWLDRHCPDPGIATCTLHARLAQGSDPLRYTASHIMFERSAALGSYRLLDDEDQRRIAAEQTGFATSVLREDPVGVTLAVLRNTLKQAARTGIGMTVPDAAMLAKVQALSPLAPDSLGQIRLLGDRGWIPAYDAFVHGLALVSLALMALLLALPRLRPPAPVCVLAGAILAGVLANAFVCGAVSQPADRYGARVIFLLPMAAAWMLLAMGQARNRIRVLK